MMELAKMMNIAKKLKKVCHKTERECYCRGARVTSFFRMYANRPVIVEPLIENNQREGRLIGTKVRIMTKPATRGSGGTDAEFVTCHVKLEPCWSDCYEAARAILRVKPCGHSWC